MILSHINSLLERHGRPAWAGYRQFAHVPATIGGVIANKAGGHGGLCYGQQKESAYHNRLRAGGITLVTPSGVYVMDQSRPG